MMNSYFPHAAIDAMLTEIPGSNKSITLNGVLSFSFLRKPFFILVSYRRRESQHLICMRWRHTIAEATKRRVFDPFVYKVKHVDCPGPLATDQSLEAKNGSLRLAGELGNLTPSEVNISRNSLKRLQQLGSNDIRGQIHFWDKMTIADSGNVKKVKGQGRRGTCQAHIFGTSSQWYLHSKSPI